MGIILYRVRITVKNTKSDDANNKILLDTGLMSVRQSLGLTFNFLESLEKLNAINIDESTVIFHTTNAFIMKHDNECRQTDGLEEVKQFKCKNANIVVKVEMKHIGG